MLKKSGGIALCALLASALTAFVAPAAGATALPSPTASAPVHAGSTSEKLPNGQVVHVHWVKNHVSGFDPAVALAHGYQIRYDSQGKPYPWKSGMSPDSPKGSVPGNCGSSYIFFGAVGNSQGLVNTGFDIGLNVTKLSWIVVVVDQRGAGQITINKGPASNVWGTTFYTNNAKGPAYAAVSTRSYAVMTNGVTCTSNGPTSGTTTIY